MDFGGGAIVKLVVFLFVMVVAMGFTILYITLRKEPQVSYTIEKINAAITTHNKLSGVEFFRLTGPDTDCIVLVNTRDAGVMAMDMKCK